MDEPRRGEATGAPSYVLGHTAHELERLQTQASLIDPYTVQFFRDAGVAPGMRILDVGSGAGDVTFLLGSLVGPTGTVLGVDRSTAAIAQATQRASARSIRNVNFRALDPFTESVGETFDAVVGRYVLQFQPDPVAALRAVTAHARPGGLVAFHEIDWGGVESFPPVAGYDQACQWIRDALAASGTETRMGIKLYRTFLDAGFAQPRLARRPVVGAGDEAAVVGSLISDLMGSLRTDIVNRGIASVEGFEQTVLAVTAGAQDRGAVLIAHTQSCVWDRVP